MTAGFLESKMSAPDVFCPRSTAGIGPSTGGDAIKIAIGGLIALAVIGYVASQWKKFD
jgi:hypothetical protein